MNARAAGCTQQTAAAKADISVRSGSRIEHGTHQPERERPHDWRTRPDPLAQVWQNELVPMLERQPKLQAMTLFEHLQQHYPGQYGRSVLRTLQRRVQQWKATAGPPKEVMFALEHRPGDLGLSDFTHFKQAEITIKGAPFVHLLYHYRLAYSGWQYVQVVQGGESFIALSEGLQNALHRCGGCPIEHRTDSLSAAYRNLGNRTEADLTQLYQRLCQHYRLRPTRNNRGIAHENGAIEASHGHFKNRLHQALLVRGSCDFDSPLDYQHFIEQVVERLNHHCIERFETERSHLQALPNYRYPDYEVLTAKVTTRSTITVRGIAYTVPSQLIGSTLTIHLHHDRLMGFVGRQQVLQLARVQHARAGATARARSVNYRHWVDSLRLKPRAFLHCTWQQDLLPDDNYRQLWQQMQAQFDSYSAARLMTEALYIAAKQDKEAAVAQYLAMQLQAEQLTLAGLQAQFPATPVPATPDLVVEQHPLTQYDQLLHHVPNSNNGHRDAQPTAQVAQAAAHQKPVARPRTPSAATGLDTRPVLAGSLRIRGDAALPSACTTHTQRRTSAARKGALQL